MSVRGDDGDEGSAAETGRAPARAAGRRSNGDTKALRSPQVPAGREDRRLQPGTPRPEPQRLFSRRLARGGSPRKSPRTSSSARSATANHLPPRSLPEKSDALRPAAARQPRAFQRGSLVGPPGVAAGGVDCSAGRRTSKPSVWSPHGRSRLARDRHSRRSNRNSRGRICGRPPRPPDTRARRTSRAGTRPRRPPSPRTSTAGRRWGRLTTGRSFRGAAHQEAPEDKSGASALLGTRRDATPLRGMPAHRRPREPEPRGARRREPEPRGARHREPEPGVGPTSRTRHQETRAKELETAHQTAGIRRIYTAVDTGQATLGGDRGHCLSADGAGAARWTSRVLDRLRG